ncbi:MAG: DUF4359 domain-containing protein [Leptolyngbya sp. SIO4C1]|nr:DUF4359 domain-containing protein [Leptolyngbya sp. SIO4C1]
MGKYLSSGMIALTVLGGVMIFTNPGSGQYINYRTNMLLDETQDAVCLKESASEWLGKVGEGLSTLCENGIKSIKSLKASEIKEFVESNTERQNLVIFSLYQMEMPAGSYRTIGLLGNFIELEHPPTERDS